MEKENKMGTMPIGRLLIKMSVPVMISMLVQALYNIVDSMFVAQISEEALTGVTLAFPIQNLMIAISGGAGVGINALVSRRLGQKNPEGAGITAGNGLFLNIMHSLIFLIAGLFLVPAFFNAQTSNPEIIAHGTDYLRIVSIFSFGSFMQITFERFLQSTGLTFYSMISQAAGAIINIVLDPIMIFGWFGLPAMGTAGAAWATVIGQVFSALIGFYFHLKYNHEIKLSLKSFKPKMAIIKEIYSVGVPSMIMMSVGSLLNIAMNNILIGFSSTATAVYGVYFRLQSFVFMPVFGMNNGMVPIIGYNLGARKPDRIKEAIGLAIRYASIIMITGFIVFQVFPEFLLGLFNASPQMIEIGKPALRIISIHFILAGASIVLGSVFQAFGLGKYSLVISMIRQLVLLLPIAYLMSLTGNINNIWWAFLISEIAALLLGIRYMKFVNKHYIEPLYGDEKF
ncbi:MATE family efflux transporter [Jeotgalibaca sp. A122]|uniref:MATE family efflux transporter n=1 Tax=Jeotgalibaca sp. A122 TaxID=3457322 RepID=UPI003FD5BF1D